LVTALLSGMQFLIPIATAATPGQESSLSQDLNQFLSWFPGEYDNYEQHYQDTEDQVGQIHEHIHHIFYPVTAPEIGEHIFFVQQYLNGDPEQIYRQRLYRIDIDNAEAALRLTIFSFADEPKYRSAYLQPEILANIERDELIERPGCEVYWRFKGEEKGYFQGYMEERTCSFVSESTGEQIFVTDDLRLYKSEIWIRDEAFDADDNRIFGNTAGIHHKNRKVEYYSGWAGVSSAGPAMAMDEANWQRPGELWEFKGELDNFSRFVIHNEGQIVLIMTAANVPSGYSVRLARLTYQDTLVPTLTLKIIENATGKTLAYSWGASGAERIGINTRWAQSGLTRRTGDEAAYGWYGKNE